MILSKEQKLAALSSAKKTLVLAGAGSGKTRVLTARIQELIENRNISPTEIIAFTFTRKAAGEIKNRLVDVIGMPAHKIICGTMHGVALNYLQRFAELVGFRAGKITIYSEWEENFLIDSIKTDLGLNELSKKDIKIAFDFYYATGDSYKIHGDFKAKILLDEFLRRCKEYNSMTYGMILINFLSLISKIKQYLNIRHVLIDEVQDNDLLQWKICETLCDETGADMFCVGDIRQSIFKFRGADPEYLIRNEENFEVFTLQDNYRSSIPIVSAANNLIAKNVYPGAPMFAKSNIVSPVSMTSGMDTTKIKEYIASIHPIRDFAVIARNHFMLKKLSRVLAEADIKHEYVGQKSGLVRSENFRKVHAFLKLIVNHHDNFSFLIVKDYLGLDSESFRRIRKRAMYAHKSYFQMLKKKSYEPKEFVKWFIASDNNDFAAVLDWLKMVEFEFETDEIFSFMGKWISENYDKTISDYLDWLALFDIQDEIKEEDPNILKLMTVHASKGLEFENVLIAGLNENIFPSTQSIRNGEIEEERRLAYVAITRAKKTLIMTSRPPGPVRFKKTYPISRFFEEVKN